jgi:chloramphenicol O-acetyltransferase type A
MGEFLDLATWKRREHFELFRTTAQPFFSTTVEVDVTAVYERTRGPNAASFLVSMLHWTMKAARETPAFCLRLRGDQVWSHEALRLSSTVLRRDETFGFAVFEPRPTLEEFAAHAVPEIERARRIGPLTIPTGDDIVYHSSLPWFRFTAFTNAINTGADSNPRIVFGQRVADGSRCMMPIAVEVHHAVVDGVDVAKFLERLEASLT